MSANHKLDLLNNSISYFREAVVCAQAEAPQTSPWKFAIVHVVQAMELAFKERLRRIHPVLIFDSVDRAEKTVSLLGALARLRNPRIGNIAISDEEKASIEKAVKLRNELTHFEFDHAHEHIELKFAEIFSFMIFFYREHLELEPSNFIDEEQHQQILLLVRTRAELIQRAKAYIKSRGDVTLWICPNCNESTFIVEDEQCCVCHRKEEIVECPNCGVQNFDSDLKDISHLFDYDDDEGLMRLVDDFGFSETGCGECYPEVREKIEEARRDQYHEDMAREYYARAMLIV